MQQRARSHSAKTIEKTFDIQEVRFGGKIVGISAVAQGEDERLAASSAQHLERGQHQEKVGYEGSKKQPGQN